MTGVINGKLYVLSTCFRPSGGGYLVSCKPLFFRYNPVSDVWATLPAPFANDTVYAPYAGGVIGGKFYVMAIRADQTGEPGSQGQVFAVYDPGTNQWTKRTPLGRARYGVATAVLGGKLYVMGGDRWNDIMYDYETLDITIVYDPATDAWTRRASMPSSRIYMAGTTVLLNGQPRIEVIGGPAPGNNLQYIP